MATAKKHGNRYRVLVFLGKGPDGKKKYKSFSGATKYEAELAAAMFDPSQDVDITVQAAIDEYIAAKTAVLSPSTITGYKTYAKNAYKDIGNIRVADLKNHTVQKWVSSLVEDKKSAKYVRNVYNLLHSVMRMYRPQKPISATLPSRPKKYTYVPTNDEIQAILPLFDEEMQLAIMLAAYCSLRCGEICALTSDDLNGNILTVSKAMSINPDGTYTVRQPKTAGSIRQVPVPAFVLERLQPIKGKIIKDRTPVMISGKFHKEMAKAGRTFRFHDLRHFFASELAKNRDIPLSTIERMGGWSAGSPVLRQVYIGAQEAEMQKNMAAAAASFDALQTKKDPQ